MNIICSLLYNILFIYSFIMCLRFHRSTTVRVPSLCPHMCTGWQRELTNNC